MRVEDVRSTFPPCLPQLENGGAKATDVFASPIRNDGRPQPRIGPRTVNTGCRLMLAGKPLPARNASYTYETCGALGQVCKRYPNKCRIKTTGLRASSTGGVSRWNWESCRRVPRREPSLDAEGEAEIAECRSELPCARLTS